MSVWYQIVVHGPEAAVRAFATGFAAAARGAPVFGADVELDPPSLGERLRERFAAGAHHLILAPEALAVPLAAALQAHGPAVGVRLDGCHRIASASFPLRIEVFARELAAERRAALLEALPPGVRVEELEEREEQHPDVQGAELYAPLHAFTWRATGRVAGELPGVLELRRRARELDFVETGQLQIRLAPGSR